MVLSVGGSGHTGARGGVINNMPRTILHLDLDAFFCAVEMLLNPALIGVPFAVGGQPDKRGVVASCSYPARRYGVRSAMPMSRAVQLCPALTIVPHHFDEYHRMSGLVMGELRQVTPLVEQISIDEAFLDVTGLKGTPQEIALGVQRIVNRYQLPCSLGVSTNKLVAKIANNMGKARAKGDTPPNAVEVVEVGKEAEYLSRLPIEELFGVGPRTAERLHQIRVRTIGDLTRIPETQLVAMFGKFGHDLYQRSRGIDERAVTTEHETKSIGRETTFTQDVRDGDVLKRMLRRQADHVAWRMRREKQRAHTVRIKLRWADFTTLSRQLTLPQASDDEDEIFSAALQLFDQTWIPGKAVRLIGVTVAGFDEQRQLSLLDRPKDERKERLHQALDDIRSRFGERSITRGSITPAKHDESDDEE